MLVNTKKAAEATGLPQGNKALILEHAAAKGKSINALVNDLIRVDMGLTLEEWKHIDKKQ